MTRGEAAGILVGGLLLICLAAMIYSTVPGDGFYGTYMCSRCGVRETVKRSATYWVRHKREVTIEDTALSLALKRLQSRPCDHRWHLLRFGASHRTVFGGGEVADGGGQFSAAGLASDIAFASELAAMPRPREIWSLIWEAGERSPSATQKLLDTLNYPSSGSGLTPFALWWKQHEAEVRRLAARPAPARGRWDAPP